jgi:dihydrofolate reductase
MSTTSNNLKTDKGFYRFPAIVAIDDNHGIGYNNKLPWPKIIYTPHFRRITSDHNMIMGRKTFQSMSMSLSSKQNIILSKSLEKKDYNYNSTVKVVRSIKELFLLLDKCHHKKSIIIGGSKIYKSFLDKDLINIIYVNNIYGVYNSDTYFPPLYGRWTRSDVKHFKKFSTFKLIKENE